jgi:hypothetical protein
LTTISHGQMTKKCSNASHFFQMKNVTLTFLVILLQITHWILKTSKKTSKKNKTLMMHSNIRQKVPRLLSATTSWYS